MGKGSKSKSSSKTEKQPKCTCDHPYNCACGNRPPRPSKGHKWYPEDQAWAGKGHKQKGASGQTASVSKEAVTTKVGQTKIQQWQQLPSKLLDDACKKEGRPRPKYKNIAKHGGYKYRVIVQDAKASKRGTDHDVILIPSSSCNNDEQAKEEAALLALLHLTPKIPHERKLPEPYKTTWLAAVSKQKADTADQPKPTSQDNKSDTASTVSSSSFGAATANVNLRAASSHASLASKKREQQDKRKARLERIRKHEAIRLANQDHQVFMSAKCRKRIESLLRGEDIQWSQDEEDEPLPEGDVVMVYVVQRLHDEGFSMSQAKTAFAEIDKQKKVAYKSEDEWDQVHDECLQWLCIHLSDDELPEGFDPRGQTLEIVAAPSSKESRVGEKGSADVTNLVETIGLLKKDAIRIARETTHPLDETIWNAIYKASCVQWNESSSEKDPSMSEIAQEEKEALNAIFPPEECTIESGDGITVVRISLRLDDARELQLTIRNRDGYYPAEYPQSILLKGGWTGRLEGFGAAIHLKLIDFVATLQLGDPMIYEIYTQVHSLLHSAMDGDFSSQSLFQEEVQTQQVPKSAIQPSSKKPPTPAKTLKIRQRARQGSSFWSKKPRETSPAISFPMITETIRRERASLPAAAAREKFVNILNTVDKKGRVFLVTGSTGCGKTTQIPQFILEEAPDSSKIVVAQPRRLAATGVATRVANERGETQAGTGSVGYVVRGDVAMCESTRLMFCTTGVLLRQLQCDRALDCVTHIIIDEVHERHLDTDILLGVLKASLAKTPHLKVILMSATIDEDRFASYFGKNTPRMHIEGRTFPVTDYMLEDVLKWTGYIPSKKRKKGSNSAKRAQAVDPDDIEDDFDLDESEMDNGTGNNGLPSLSERLKRVDEATIDYDMLGYLVRKLLEQGDCKETSILVFLPGAPEINMAMNTLQKMLRGFSARLLPLHGGLQPKEQNLIFRPVRTGWTNVILSTNIAETSITIKNCTVVIDTCREKQLSYDAANRMPLLQECFASKASIKQRRGRAGRVREGTCYKLISRKTHSRLPEHGEPEIKRCALDQTLLSLLFLRLEDGTGSFLGTLLDPPSTSAIQAALSSLEKLGAVRANEHDSKSLTPLGMHLAGIPAPPSVGKMLIMGCILGCRRAALAMAAGMSVGRSPFLRVNVFTRKKRSGTDEEEDESQLGEEERQRMVLKEREALIKKAGKSDHAVLAAAYLEWDRLGTGGGGRKRYCEKLGLSFNGMKEMRQLAVQLDSSVSQLGFRGASSAEINSSSWRIVRACAVAALAPSQLVRVQRPSTKYTETVEGAVEKEGEARELKFFIRRTNEGGSTEESSKDNPWRKEERVFMHPSSANFQVGNYNCPWLVYNELVRTSKSFLRDATECSAYSLLLFGGDLQVQAAKGVIFIDNWVRLAANPRIGALVGGIRRRLDDLLVKKVENPSFDIAGTNEMKIIVSLLVSDGLGN